MSYIQKFNHDFPRSSKNIIASPSDPNSNSFPQDQKIKPLLFWGEIDIMKPVDKLT